MFPPGFLCTSPTCPGRSSAWGQSGPWWEPGCSLGLRNPETEFLFLLETDPHCGESRVIGKTSRLGKQYLGKLPLWVGARLPCVLSHPQASALGCHSLCARRPATSHRGTFPLVLLGEGSERRDMKSSGGELFSLPTLPTILPPCSLDSVTSDLRRGKKKPLLIFKFQRLKSVYKPGL